MQALKTSLCHAVVAILVQLVTMTTGTEFHCHGTCYKGEFRPEKHVSKDYALLGHSFRNLSDLTDQECFSACISDCRCLSFQRRDSSCELLEEDRGTAAQDFGQVPGYAYYDITQEFVQQVCNDNPQKQIGIFSARAIYVAQKGAAGLPPYSKKPKLIPVRIRFGHTLHVPEHSGALTVA